MSTQPLHVRFASFDLDEDAYLLRKDGAAVAIERKPMALLIHLIRNRHRVMRRDELLEAIWPGVIVSDDVLAHGIKKIREALGEAGVTHGSIQTVRGVGFRFIPSVEPVEDRADPADHRTASPRPALIGRDAEVERLQQILATSFAGAGRIVLITGDAGIGKSRLADDAAVWARRAGAEVHIARARQGLGAPAFWVWAQVLRGFVEEWTPEDLTAALGDAAVDVSRAVPMLREQIALPAPERADSDEARFRLMEGIARLLSRAARKRPQLLLLDDLQWADPASLLMLGFLAGEIGAQRIAIVATCRSDEVEPSSPLQEAVEECEHHDVLVRMPLAGLDVQAVARLIDGVARFEVSDEVARAAHAWTGGNPLFVKQIVDLLVAEQPFDTGSSLVPHIRALPTGMRRIIGRRLARLSDPCRRVLRVASIVGREFALAVVARACALDREKLLASLREAAEAQVIENGSAPGGDYHFVHHVVRDVVYAELDEATRVNLHRRVAEALEAVHAAHLSPVVPALAYHYGEAAPLLDGTEAVDYAKAAGDLARDAVSYEEAAAHFERALRALDLVPTIALERRAELLVCLGYAYQSAGRQDRRRDVLLEAAAVARRACAPSLLAVAALGLAELGVAVFDPEAVALLEEALLTLPEEPSFLRVWVEGVLATHLVNQPGRIADAERIVDRAERSARALGDSRNLAYALTSRAAVQRLSPSGRPDERLRVLAEAAELGGRTGDTSIELMARLQRSGALLELAERDLVEAELERVSLLLEKLRSPYWGFLQPVALLLLLEGRFTEAEERFAQALRLTRHGSAGPPAASVHEVAFRASVIGMIRYEQGRTAELLPMLSALVEQTPHLPVLRAGRMLSLIESKRDVELQAELDELARDDFSSVVGTESWVCALAYLADACVHLGDCARARSITTILESRADHCIIMGSGHYCHGPVSLYLAKLALTTGELDTAERYVDIAVDRAEKLRSPVWRTHSQAVGARLHLQRGEVRQARSLAREAISTAHDLGMARVGRELAALGNTSGSSAPRQTDGA